jgi:hypothetical protein
MDRILYISFVCLVCLSVSAGSALAEAVSPEVRWLELYSDDGSWIYHYTRTLPTDHPDEALPRDHHLAWRVNTLQTNDGTKGGSVTFYERGGPDDAVERAVTWRVDPAGCWSMDARKGKPGPRLCAVGDAPDVEVGDATLRGLIALRAAPQGGSGDESKRATPTASPHLRDAVAVISPEVGVVSLTQTFADGVIESWTLAGYSVKGAEGGAFDLWPVRCDWDESLKLNPDDEVTTLRIGDPDDEMTVELISSLRSLKIFRNGWRLWSDCLPERDFVALKGWVDPDGDGWVIVQDVLRVSAQASPSEHGAIVFHIMRDEVKVMRVSAQLNPSQDERFAGVMMMQSGSDCVLELRVNEDKTKRRRSVASFPLTSWPLKRSRGRLPTSQNLPNREDWTCNYPPEADCDNSAP